MCHRHFLCLTAPCAARIVSPTDRRIPCRSVEKRTDEEAIVTIIDATVLLKRPDYLALLMREAERAQK